MKVSVKCILVQLLREKVAMNWRRNNKSRIWKNDENLPLLKQWMKQNICYYEITSEVRNMAAEAKVRTLRKVVNSEHLGLGQHVMCTKLRVSSEFWW